MRSFPVTGTTRSPNNVKPRFKNAHDVCAMSPTRAGRRCEEDDDKAIRWMFLCFARNAS
jgi:hypothetical protein